MIEGQKLLINVPTIKTFFKTCQKSNYPFKALTIVLPSSCIKYVLTLPFDQLLTIFKLTDNRVF